jgi:hypothetical protein
VSTRALGLLIAQGGLKYEEPIMEDEGGYRSDLIATSKHAVPIAPLKAYPNPTPNMLIVDYALGGVSRLEVLDLTGRVILTQNTSATTTQFAVDLSALPLSLYELVLFDANGTCIASTPVIKN